MTLEQLQEMSDTELNKLAAVKVMECRYIKGWNPAGDMNDALELVREIAPHFGRIEMVAVDGMCVCSVFKDDITLVQTVESYSMPRAVTIATILTKEDRT